MYSFIDIFGQTWIINNIPFTGVPKNIVLQLELNKIRTKELGRFIFAGFDYYINASCPTKYNSETQSTKKIEYSEYNLVVEQYKKDLISHTIETFKAIPSNAVLISFNEYSFWIIKDLHNNVFPNLYPVKESP